MNLETHQPESRPASLADVLESRQDDIFHHWVEQLREGLAPKPSTRSVLADHMGDYLRELVTVLHRVGQEGAAAVPGESSVAREHGRQRLCLGFDLAVLVREYGVLHECILDSVEQTGTRVTLAEFRALTSFIVHGIADAVEEYTHQRDAAQRLNELRLQELLDQAPVAVCAKDTEGRYLIANRHLQEILERSREEILGQDNFALFPEELANLYQAPDTQVLAGHTCVNEVVMHTPWGPRTYLATKFPLPGGEGTPAAIGCIATDITERKEAEAARAQLLREAEAQRERLDSLFQQSPAFIFVMQGPEHILTLANPLTVQRLGGRELVGKPLREAIPELVEQGYGELIDNVYRTGKPAVATEAPLWLVPPEGGEPKESFFSYVYTPTHGPDGQVDGVLIHAVEVTELVGERHRAEEALALLDTLLTTAPVAMSFLDRELRYVRVNQMLADELGIPIEHIQGHRLEALVPPEVAAQHTPIQRQVLETGQPVFGHEEKGTPSVMGGELRHWLCNHAPVRNRAGEVILVASVALDITERKRAESAVEERFRLLVEGVEDYAIFMLDPKGRVTSWNPGAERIKGWKASEVLGRSLSLFYLPGDVVAGVPEEALQLAATEGQHRAEVPLVRKDGSRFWADVLLTALRDERGNLRGFAMITRDISPRRQAEEALRATTQRLEAILETAVDGILTIDELGRIQSINPATVRIFGHPPEKLLGQDFLQLLPEPYMSGNIQPGGRKLFGNGREVRGRREDGSLFPLELSVGETRLSHGRFFTCLVRDISARKHAEEAQALFVRVGTLLSQSLDVQTTLKSLASLVVNHLADYCMVDLLGEDGQLRRLEVAARDPERQALIRRSMFSSQIDSSLLPRILEGGAPVAQPEPTPEWLDALARDPTHRAFLEALDLKSLLLVPLVAHGRKLGLISFAWSQPRPTCATTDLEVARGVADRAAQALDNARLYQEAQEAIRVREDVVAIVSHDLRTPLNAISLSATALLKREGLDKRITTAIGRIRSAADRATRMIRDLLDFNQARMKGIPVHREPLDFHAHVLRVLKEVRLAHPGRHIAFHSRGEGRGEWDGDRLAQVLTNLVGNALQHSPAGSPVRVSTWSEDSCVLLEVHNENAGRTIPPHVLSTLFEPYRRGPEAEAGQGSLGLGLFITRQIILAHGGGITVRSTPEEGTTFTVRLPRIWLLPAETALKPDNPSTRPEEGDGPDVQ